MNPQLFGKEHILYIVISILFAVGVCICAKKFAKTEKSQKIIMKCAGVLLFVTILANRLSLVFEGDVANWKKLITDSFCSTTSYVLSLTLIFGKKDNNVLHFVWFIALVGGIATTFAPDFIGQNPSFLYPPTILGLLHHTFSAICVVLAILFKYVNLTIKKWYCTLIGFVSYIEYGAFLFFVFILIIQRGCTFPRSHRWCRPRSAP